MWGVQAQKQSLLWFYKHRSRTWPSSFGGADEPCGIAMDEKTIAFHLPMHTTLRPAVVRTSIQRASLIKNLSQIIKLRNFRHQPPGCWGLKMSLQHKAWFVRLGKRFLDTGRAGACCPRSSWDFAEHGRVWMWTIITNHLIQLRSGCARVQIFCAKYHQISTIVLVQ